MRDTSVSLNNDLKCYDNQLFINEILSRRNSKAKKIQVATPSNNNISVLEINKAAMAMDST